MEPIPKKPKYERKNSSPIGLVIADDVTGACDAALAISKSGLNVSIVPDYTSLVLTQSVPAPAGSDEDTPLQQAQVIVVSSNSREVDSPDLDDFYTTVRRFIENNKEIHVYLKVDSSVRGNIPKDITVAMKNLGRKHCVLAPALPEAGRTTVGGIHLLHGVPVSKSLAQSSMLATASKVPAVLGGEVLPVVSSLVALVCRDGYVATDDVKLVNIDTVLGGKEAVASSLSHITSNRQESIAVVDAVEQEHLRTLAQAVAMQPQRMLLCGSAGLAAELATAWSAERHCDQAVCRAPQPAQVPTGGEVVVFVIGSDSPTCSTQLHTLHSAVTCLVEVDCGRGTAGGVDAKLESLQKGECPTAVVLRASMNEGASETTSNIITGLCTVAKDFILRLGSKLAGLVVSGGYTLKTLLSMLRSVPTSATGGAVQRFDVVGEISSCTPLLRAVGGQLDNQLIVTKGGRLGGDDAFLQAYLRLKKNDTHVSQAPMDTSQRPVLAITMGDVAGIGPEIVAKVLSLAETWQLCRPIVVGSKQALAAANKITGGTIEPLEVHSASDIDWTSISSFLVITDSGSVTQGRVPVITNVECAYEQIALGKVSPLAGRCAAEWVIKAVQLCVSGEADAIVTAPLNKESMNKAGYAYAGHTELLAKHSGARTSRLMLASEKLKVVHATGHCSLADVPSKLTVERLSDTIVMAGEFLHQQGMAKPRIAIAGLNPHAGDGGLFGDEERTVLAPAIAKCRALGHSWTVSDPIPSDTLFCRTLKGEFDIVIAMYHDQGHIPAKLTDFGSTVNVTLGLPIIRTSVDHGTAFDIAGKGIADSANLLHAIRLAARMARK
ncbi:uncharacterized protein LOC135822356 [Sycon ciliatum]|uniref:uncharacterized protein LOC135822356 n=1 Tax=Sycon ciliatum TaxID=27933 RepID=UPI0031F64C09